MRRAHVWVSGRVQGVFYRQSCLEEAVRLGVAGWVRNLPDGRVEAVFEGPPDAVERAIAWCRVGPRSARVSGVEVRDESVTGAAGFRIAR